MRESDIQRAIVEYLAVVLPDALVWAVPNAAVRRNGGRAGNGVPGLRKGVFDLSMILPDGRFAAIEVKAKGGRLSPEQSEFLWAMTDRRIPHLVAYSVDDVRFFLSQLGVKTREVL